LQEVVHRILASSMPLLAAGLLPPLDYFRGDGTSATVRGNCIMRGHFVVILLRISRYPFLYIFGIGAYAIASVAASLNLMTSQGLHNLFLEDVVPPEYGWGFIANRPSLLSQVALSQAIAFAWFVPPFADGEFDEGTLADKIRRWALRELPWVLAVNVLLSGLIVYLQWTVIDAEVKTAQITYSVLGLVVGLLVSTATIALALYPAHRFRFPPIYGLLGLYAVLIIWALKYTKLIPAACLFTLFILITFVYVGIKLLPERWRLVSSAGVAVAMIVGYNLSVKSQFPGIDRASGVSYYAEPVKLEAYYEFPRMLRNKLLGRKVDPDQLSDSWLKYTAGRGLTEGAQSPGDDRGLNPVDVLEAWKRTLGGGPARLVVVSTSGGAYRASFWTTLILDRIIEESTPNGRTPGLQHSIRFLTGASGGMVAAAYFAATREEAQTRYRPAVLTKTLTDDIEKSQLPSKLGRPGSTWYPVPRDSLSPVTQQMIQGDIPSAFLPWMGEYDRGKKLEDSWGSLDVKFEDLKSGEEAGWRPSLVLSPMVVDTGAPILISNLSLKGIIEAGSEQLNFFQIFPEARNSFRLKTAVRMSATFPYISPIVELPTSPPQRVVDAGYYDNYGVGTATAILREPNIMKWLKENVEGIMIVQIRASAVHLPPDSKMQAPVDGFCKQSRQVQDGSGPFTWLTGPLEGAAAGRAVSMRVRNDQALNMLADIYGLDRNGRDFLQWVVFENSARASATWSLPHAELECFREQLDLNVNKLAFAKLEEWWRATGATESR
jgi:hypothetical protein